MKKLLSIVFTLLSITSFACTHTLRMTDTWGDGWNGGTVSVSVNGVVVLTNVSLASGSGPMDLTFNANAGDVIRVYQTAAGSYPSEMMTQILDNASGIVITNHNPIAGTATTGGTTGTGFCASPQVVTSSTVTQTATSTIPKCGVNQAIVCLQVVATGSASPLTLTQIQANIAGSIAIGAISNVDVYFTGTNSTYSTSTLFGSAAPSFTTFNVNGSVSLLNGTNYFWLVLDLNNTGATGATVDALITQFTAGGLNYNSGSSPNIATTNPAGNATLSICTGPGGVLTGLDIWVKANSGINNQSNSGTVVGANGAPSINTTAQTYNYNPYIDFTAPAGVYTANSADPTRQFLFLQGYNGVSGVDYRTLFWTANLTDLTRVNTHLATVDDVTHSAPSSTLHGASSGTNAAVNDQGYDINDFGSAAAAGTWKRNGVNMANLELHTSVKQIISAWSSAGGGTTLNRFFGGQRDHSFNGFMGSPRDWKGPAAELIGYTTKITATERQKIHSYLAIKYGVTLVEDYLNTTGNNIYPTTTSGAYINNIIGIGRDDAEALTQKQSHYNSDLVRIYLGTLAAMNTGNSNTFTVDNSYVVMGDNNGAHCTTAAALAEMPTGLTNCTLYSRLEKEWKVQRTNMAQTYNMDVALAACGNPGSVNVADLRLLVDDDGNFANGGTQCYYIGDGTGINFTYSNPYITVQNISTTHIPNNSTKYITIASVNSATPLPVELLSFEAKLNPKVRQVDLSWTTQSEINAAYFEVQKLENNNWVYLDQVAAHGNPNMLANYSSVDVNPVLGNNYYRLKQVDQNGAFTFSDIRVVNLGENAAYISVFPNPASNSLQVVFKGIADQKIEIIDATGRILNVSYNQTSDNSISINTEAFANGYYTIRIIGDKLLSERFIINH